MRIPSAQLIISGNHAAATALNVGSGPGGLGGVLLSLLVSFMGDIFWSRKGCEVGDLAPGEAIGGAIWDTRSPGGCRRLVCALHRAKFCLQHCRGRVRAKPATEISQCRHFQKPADLAIINQTAASGTGHLSLMAVARPLARPVKRSIFLCHDRYPQYEFEIAWHLFVIWVRHTRYHVSAPCFTPADPQTRPSHRPSCRLAA